MQCYSLISFFCDLLSLLLSHIPFTSLFPLMLYFALHWAKFSRGVPTQTYKQNQLRNDSSCPKIPC
ncbi:hypothetical protein RvY_13256 [Ramazzottius varieornatus]|uniref:Uncharacterized protein n=1 Tax=Ramazzottius varieornatus TaxID=947166 RepID=A0A1D1VMB0_RAMVA|nr:hypothetical protein RvY_13256 [Ramazzottius varieornatus]